MENQRTESGNGVIEMEISTAEKEKYQLLEEELLKFKEKQKIVTDNGLLKRYQVMNTDLLRPLQKTGIAGKIWIGFLVVVFLCGIYAYFLQESTSKYETISLQDYTMWGVYISTFVFYVALSLVGVLISATLRLIKFDWYRPLSRISEIISFASIMMAGICIVAAMGRPDKLFNVILYGRIQSPIVWDVLVVVTYVIATFLVLFMGLLPEISNCRDRLTSIPNWKKWLYKNLTFGWNGAPKQWEIVKKSIFVLAVMIIPVGLITQAVDAWLFATTLRPEWDSANMAPYFVSGAFALGAAAMIVAVYIFRKVYNLEKYLTEKHFDHLGKSLVFLSLCYLYLNINEYMIPAYKMSGLTANHLTDLFTGKTSQTFWLVGLFAIAIPAILPMFKAMRKPLPLTIIAVFAVMAAWVKRYLIVVPGLSHPLFPIQGVPESWLHYFPSLVEMTVIAASFAAFLLIITIFSKLFPIISIWEVAEGEGVNIQKIYKSTKTEQL